MTLFALNGSESKFMHDHLPLFLRRFSLTYYREDFCIEYFISRRTSHETVSSALIFAYNPQIRFLHVSRFYPELCQRTNSRYLSAVCFYLLIHHSAAVYCLDNTCHIRLETVEKTNMNFYSRLGDLNFRVSRHGVGDVVELTSDIILSSVDTSIIRNHVLQPGEIPFLK
ncbi:MAG: hypothetical protein R6U68_06240 [Desulfobacteraceae bacterium]